MGARGCDPPGHPTLTGHPWRTTRHELDRMHLFTLSTGNGTLAQRTLTTPGQRTLLGALALSEPPRFYDFTPTTATDSDQR